MFTMFTMFTMFVVFACFVVSLMDIEVLGFMNHQPRQHQPRQHQPRQHQPRQHQPRQHRGLLVFSEPPHNTKKSTNKVILEEIQQLRKELKKQTSKSSSLEEQLKKQSSSFEEELKKQTSKSSSLEEQLKKQNSKIEVLQTQVGGIRQSLQPATVFALMETAVYEKTKHLFTSSKYLEKNQYASSAVGSAILRLFSVPEANESLQSFRWSGRGVDKDKMDEVFCSLCFGLILFIQCPQISACELEDWPPERNVLVHDGKLVRSLYYEVDSVDADILDLAEEDCRSMMERFQETSKYQEMYQHSPRTMLETIESSLKEKQVQTIPDGIENSMSLLERMKKTNK